MKLSASLSVSYLALAWSLLSLPMAAYAQVDSAAPTGIPSMGPTTLPSMGPTNLPSSGPTNSKSAVPSVSPSNSPSESPSNSSAVPSGVPSLVPTFTDSWIDLEENEGYFARSECAFVQAGDKMILFGGVENPRVLDTYDYGSDTWTVSAEAPADFNHFQALEYEGLVWVVGAYTNNAFPSETPATAVHVFDPVNNVWMQGPPIPAGRERGASGLVVYSGKLYMVGGSTNGHSGGFVSWFDEYDPVTATWTVLPNAPRPRDHFQAVIFNAGDGEKLYAVAGRTTGAGGGVNHPEVDVYDFVSGTWDTLPESQNLPTPRAGAGTVVFEDKILVMGGESMEQDPPANHDIVEAFDGTAWATIAPMNYARHGFQALVSGTGVVAIAGSPNVGGGSQKNMEAYKEFSPVGVPSTAGVLVVAESVSVTASPTAVRLEHTGGNTGIFVTSLSLTSSTGDFAITSSTEPFLIPVGGYHDVLVSVTDTGAEAVLEISYSGQPAATVSLSSPPSTTSASLSESPSASPSLGTPPLDASASPSESPSASPSESPSLVSATSASPSASPSISPSVSPSDAPSDSPSTSTAPSTSVAIEETSTSPSEAPSDSPSTSPSVSTAAFDPIFINCGGPEYTDSASVTWQADSFGGYYGTDGWTAANYGLQITDVEDGYIYQSERTGPGTVTYDIPVPAGMYDVKLHFAEIYWTEAGKRIMDIAIEGTTVETNYDVWTVAGGKGIGYVETYGKIEVVDGVLTIAFTTKLDQMKIAGIEIVETKLVPTASPTDVPSVSPSESPSTSPSVSPTVSMAPSLSVQPTKDTEFPSSAPTTSPMPSASPSDSMVPSAPPSTSTAPTQLIFEPIYINSGGASFIDSNGIEWQADVQNAYYTGGFAAGNFGLSIADTEDDTMYKSERTGAGIVSYEIPVPPGFYDVELHFAEIYWDAAGSRIMDIAIEGTTVETNYDVWAKAQGKGVAIIETYGKIQVDDGALTITFTTKLDQMKVSAIAVTKTKLEPTASPTDVPSVSPSESPSASPSVSPTVSMAPSLSLQPSRNTAFPSSAPTTSPMPSASPSESVAPSAAPSSSLSPTFVPAMEPMFINCGGADFTDSNGVTWLADSDTGYFSGGFAAANFGLDIAGTVDDAVYQSERTGAGTVSYEIPVPTGFYEVKLHFAEIYWDAAGSRLMDIAIEGTTVETNYDVWAKAQGKGVAIIETYSPIKVTDGALSLVFTAKLDQMKIAGIEIAEARLEPTASPTDVPSVSPSESPSTAPSDSPSVSMAPSLSLQPTRGTAFPSSAPTTSTMPSASPSGSMVPSASPSTSAAPTELVLVDPIFINCGGAAYTDSNLAVWQADADNEYFTGGFPAGNFGLDITGTEDGTIYKSERTGGGTVSYNIPVPAGTYEVKLHFAEIYWDAPGKRLMDIALEGTTVETNYDVWTKAGGKGVATIETYGRVVVEDGMLTITFTAKLDQMKVSAIQVAKADLRPTGAPSVSPSASPSETPSSAPSDSPSLSMAPSLSLEPTRITDAPSFAPSTSAMPSDAPSVSLEPSSAPSLSQVPSSSPTFGPFEDLYINCGWDDYTDVTGQVWKSELSTDYGSGGVNAANFGLPIAGTFDDPLYQSERTGGTLTYTIPLQPGEYEVDLHFAEIYFDTPDSRVFDVKLQGQVVTPDLDIWTASGGKGVRYQRAYTVIIGSDPLLIELVAKPGKDQAKISGFVVKYQGDHLAHAVPGGPYAAVDADNDGFGLVEVDAFQSHTHGLGNTLVKFDWRFNGEIIATTQKATLRLPLGINVVTLVIEDDGGNPSSASVEIEVLEFGNAYIDYLTPDSGDIFGGEDVYIFGSGFDHPETDIVVDFGAAKLTGTSIQVMNATCIRVIGAPSSSDGAPVKVKVTNPISTSNFKNYGYFSGVPINFVEGLLLKAYGPTSILFAPNGNLYFSTLSGVLHKVVIDDDYNILDHVISKIVTDTEGGGRNVMGIAIDPMDVRESPDVYVSHSNLFHGSCEHSAGPAINGKVSIVSGANLDSMVDIVRGLPVSDHDHAPNGIYFGDNGELYMMIGGNTNGGVPGGLLTGCGEQKENYYSGATLKFDLANPSFQGFIEYDPVSGDPLDVTVGVEVFAPGSRNPWDIVLHSNGDLYSTDNGPNTDYGKMSADCDTDAVDPNFSDELNLVRPGDYHGHPNRKRGETDPRQCTFKGPYESSDSEYRAPLTVFPSSTDGITEFETMHFGGQLRGDLIAGKFVGVLWRIILSEDGESAPNGHFVLDERGGLDVTQAPDGTLFIAGVGPSEVTYLIPDEAPSASMIVKSSWPRRGPGGGTLTLFGELFDVEGPPTVTVGGEDCNFVAYTATKITCTLPSGSGKADVVVTSGTKSSTLTAGYRYIAGGNIFL